MSVRRVLGGLMVALLAAACSSSGSTPVPAPRSPTSASPAALPAGLTAATSATLQGFWKPTGSHGQSSSAYVLFSSNGSVWSGSDGCNAFNGHYSLGAHGALTASSGASTLIGCDNWQGPMWVSLARRVAISGTKLVLFDKSGQQLGAMVKLAE